MATMYLREVQFTNEDGKPEVGRCVAGGYPSAWIKVLRADGSHIMLRTGEYRIVTDSAPCLMDRPPPVARLCCPGCAVKRERDMQQKAERKRGAGP